MKGNKMGEARRRARSKQYIYDPKPDITAFELALMLPMLFGEDIETTVFNNPKYSHLNVIRHFIVKDPEKALEN